jgi:DNA-binding NtrC family response regulator
MKEKLLIIDDEKIIVEYLEILLEQEGFRIKTALTGEAGLELFRSESFDLVITDIRMPGISGLEVVRQIKALDEDMEIIILTGFATIDNVIKGMRADGAFDYQLKPIDDVDSFLNSIARALEKRKLRMETKVLLSQLKMAAAASRANNDFLTNMSIDLRNLLDAVMAFSEAFQCENGEFDQKQTAYINDILQNGNHLLTLINDIPDFFRKESGRSKK